METTRISAWLRTLLLAAPLVIAGCTSSMGGSTMPPSPAGPEGAPNQGIQPAAAPVSRQKVAEVSVPLASAAPQLQASGPNGFGLVIDLTKPASAASPKPGASATATATAKASAKPSPSPTPKPSPTATPTPAPTGSAKPSPAPSGTPSGPAVSMRFTIYPDGTQKPPGDFESDFTRRVPVVDILLKPSVNLKLYSLAALGVQIPSSENTASRGFTVALYETRKFHKDREMEYHVDAQVSDGVVRATSAKDALDLAKGHEYTIILFGDPLAATPSAYSPPNYPGMPGFGQSQQNGNAPTMQQPGGGSQRPGATPPTPYPFATATPSDDGDDGDDP
jgi:hypothetical protein